ncbi:MAG: (deoxy)nucleoside triphosphate pyrophosphohydrolase, partial [Calditrichaeota bacterium]|nr:(deoxy)nucleoside triphosphate pyrophosphohydrolase [Calditrichota bacterium]
YTSYKQILITKRPGHLHLGGLWEFPGGKVEKNERYQQALKREIKEETGLEIVVADLYWKESVSYPEKKVNLFFYNCTLVGENQEIFLHEIDDFRWVKIVELGNYSFPVADNRLIEELKKIPVK